jgi:hypothetical protein
MLVSIVVLLFITAGGMALTYLYEAEDRFLVRVCAGNVIGAAIFTLAIFVLACFFGLSAGTISVAILLTLIPLVLLVRKTGREAFLADWRKFVSDKSGDRLSNLIYYGAIILLLYFFFDRAMFEEKGGIFTGVLHNLGDLHFHLDTIFSFTEEQNFPPDNPSYAGAKFTYPFMADVFAAALVKLGATVREALFWQNITLGFSLVVLLENFTVRLTGNKLAGRIAPLLLLFSGGLGFLIFFKDLFNTPADLTTFLAHLPNDYTMRFDEGSFYEIPWKLRWGNPLITLFITQRSILFGMPLALIVLTQIWKIFSAPFDDKNKKLIGPLVVGLLCGTLPLVHAHSLLAVLFVAGFAALFSLDKLKQWLAFFVGVGLVAGPELLWAMSGSATHLAKFIDWHLGWDSGNMNSLVFWIFNLGLFIPLLLVVLVLMLLEQRRDEDGKELISRADAKKLLLFYIPFGLFFIICNLVKLAPWEWDNIKVLIYWFVGSAPLVALLLAKIWERGKYYPALALAAIFVLTFSGALDVYRVGSAQEKHSVADPDAVKIADDIKRFAEPKALFLNAPIYNSPVGLSGRRSLMRYSGHLASYGIDYQEREQDVKTIYGGSALADSLLQKYNIEYVMIGPDERDEFKAREDFFRRFAVVAEEGQYRVYKIKK